MLRLSKKHESTSLPRQLLVTLLFVLSTLFAAAQGVLSVTGTVTNEQNQPVVGASVIQVGTNRGAVTDGKGKFILTVTNRDAKIKASFIGMAPVTIALAGKTTLNIVLADEKVAMGEVVVTALGIKREAKALGYAVSTVNNEALTAGREQNVMQAMVGKVAGVDISTTTAGPTGSTRVLIRGNSQLTGSNLPLYVVDGMPVDNTQLAGADGKYGGSGFDFGDVLSSINPDDIENISVLKGPSASALYGSMASNGVIMITTKSGSKKKSLGIEVSSNVSIVSLLSGFDDYQREYGMGRNGVMPLSESDAVGMTQVAWGAKLDPNLMTQIYNKEWKPYGNVNNNVLSFFDTGVTLQNSVSFSNATERTTFRVAVSDMRNWDIVPKSTFDRTNITTRGQTRLGKNINIDVSATYTSEKVDNRPALSDNESNIGNALIGLAPNFDQRWLADSYKDKEGNYYQWNGSDYRFNPYWVINEMRNESSRNRLMGQARASWDVTPWLKLSMRAGLDTYNFRFSKYSPMSTPRVVQGGISERTMNVTQLNYEGMITFHKKISDFDINAFVGASVLKYKRDEFNSDGLNQVLTGVWDVNGFERVTTTHSLPRKEVRSLFASASVGYKGLAYIDATVRNDTSSALAPENRSYAYPSVSGSLIFSNLFQHGNWLTFGKVRTSWAKVGGDTDPYQLALEFGLKPYKLNGTSLGEVAPSGGSIPNYNIKPTSTYSIEAGLEMKFFNNRLGFDLTLYQQTTHDQIMRLPISSATGFTRGLINAGMIRNKGIELTLDATPVNTRGFSWNTTVTFSRNKNQVLELHESVPNYELTIARWAGAAIYAMENEPYGVILGKAIKRNPEGKVIVDKTGMPTFESEMSVLGNGTFDFTTGWSNTFTYRNFNVRTLIDAKFGADVYSMSMMQSYYNGTSKETLKGRDAWYRSEQDKLTAGSPANWVATGGYMVDGVREVVVDGKTTYVQNDIYVNPQSYWQSFQDNSPEPFIVDASFIKLREIAITYNFPMKWFSKTPIAGLSLSAYGRNLCIIYSNVKNIDPESSYYNGNGQGFEYGSLPSRRTFGFGVNIKF